jgi:hypothetical protein
MAQIDLRNADFFVSDGTTTLGAINQAGGYPIGATTIVVDGFAVAIANASTFTIAGDTTTYTVSSTVGGSTPTSITFTPALVVPVGDNVVVSSNLTGGAINDAAGGAIGAGTVTVDGLAKAIAVGSKLIFSGHATVYTISGSTGGSTPTALTFTPTLTSAVIDNETFTIKLLGAINHAGGTPPSNGDSSITVDGFSAAIAVGTKFTLAGSSDTYEVLGTTGGATPTAISFSPALRTAAGLPVDNAIVTLAGNTLKLKVGEGNLTYEEKRTMEYVREKRSVGAGFVRTGDDDPTDVSIDLIWEFISSDAGDPPTPDEVFKKIGGASSWVTSGTDPCEPYSVDVTILYTPPCSGVKRERIVLKEFRWESISHDTKQGMLAVKGKCKILTPTVTREVA